jgi:uncharacterized protein with HEPN domain
MVVDDRTRIRHMLDAAREAVGFAAGRSRADLDRNRQLALALLKCLEIVGEAASQVTEAMRTRYSGIPWADVVGMRNRLVHTYFDIDLNLVWDTVTRDLPPLIAGLEKLDPPRPPR